MNIAVFGWYHHQNAGDDRMQQCITRWLDGHCLAFLPSGRPPPLALLRTYDAAIIGGGSLVNAHAGLFRHMRRWVRSAGIPVAMLGVTVDAVTPELRQELREFLDVCCLAWFRDEASLALIGPHPRAFVAPDITWLYPHPIQSPSARHPPPAAALSPTAVAVCLRRQRDLPVAAWREALAKLGVPCLPWLLYFENGGDSAVLREALPAAPPDAFTEEFSLTPLRQADAVISSRFHGVLFALQSGVPVLAVSALPKTIRFMEQAGLGDWVIPEAEPARLAAVWPRFVAHLPELRATAFAIRDRLHAEARAAGDRAREQLLAAAGKLAPPNRRSWNRVRTMLNIGDMI